MNERPRGEPAILPDRWHELEPLLDKVLEADTPVRPALIAALCASDSDRAALEAMLAECLRGTQFLDRPAFERFDDLVRDDLPLDLPEILGGSYRILQEIGRGGMARVYRAEDFKHARSVAVKVIRPELAASLGRDRFLREIGIAARLRHPNIMPLYDSGDADGVLYFVMPFEDGPSLRSRLGEGKPLPLRDALSALRDVARALAYAHEQGIVHRDVKPDNVMISGGAAVVTDFGIAKAVSAARTDRDASAITQVGVSIGTPAYMAPEQALGDPTTDHRADIYSFGCLAYEMLVGVPPFTGETTQQILSAHLMTVPPSVISLRPEVPEPVSLLIQRCLEKNASARPQQAGELFEVLAMLPVSGTYDRPVPRRRSWRGMGMLVAAITLVIAIATLARRAVHSNDGNALLTVAVRPFASTGGDASQQLMAEGFGDDVAMALVRFPWVRIKSRDGVSAYDATKQGDPRTIARLLGVRYLVTGAFRGDNGVTSVVAQLIDSEDGSVLWADRFDRPAALSVVRDEIVRAISDSLRARAGPDATALQPRGAAHRGNDDAYRIYLVGKRKLDQRGQSLVQSIALFREALALDSTSADAFSGLAFALALSPYFHLVSTDSVAAEATVAARRALRLEKNLAQPHTALGLVLMHDRQWDRAELEFRAGLQLDTHDVEARVQYGRFLVMRDRIMEGQRQFQAARVDDPASAVVSIWTAYAYFLEGYLDSAQTELTRARQIDEANAPTAALGALILLATGHPREARALVDLLPPTKETTLYVTAASGDRATTLQRIASIETARPRPWLAETKRAYALLGLGDTARAIDAFAAATAARELWPMLHPTRDPMFDAIRGNRRFRALLAKEGLPSDVSSARTIIKTR